MHYEPHVRLVDPHTEGNRCHDDVHFFRARRPGIIAGTARWGAPTLEWTIPSPPPEYNFATLPTVRSRYPLWDMKSPRLTSDVPHSKAGDERVDVEIAGREVATAKPMGGAGTRPNPEAGAG